MSYRKRYVKAYYTSKLNYWCTIPFKIWDIDKYTANGFIMVTSVVFDWYTLMAYIYCSQGGFLCNIDREILRLANINDGI